MTKIEWTNESWNPTIGCTRTACMNLYCYACKMALRLKNMGHADYQLDNPFEPRFIEHRLNIPFKWKKPRMIFVDSMGDLFDENIREKDIIRIFDIIERNPNHIFQILTKQLRNMVRYVHERDIPPNLWLGITQDGHTTNDDDIEYFRSLEFIPRKFVSFEPLLGPIVSNFYGIDWVIIGAQTGNGAKPPKDEWVTSIIAEAECWDIPVFLKDNLNWPTAYGAWQQWPAAMEAKP